MNSSCNLVLSGGGMRGYAHVGAVKALMENGISFKAISGASAGALIGAFLCDGFHPEEIEEIILKNEPQFSFNYKAFWDSLLSFNSFAEVLKKNLRSKTLEALPLPLYVSVTNLNTGFQEVLVEGNIIDALTASSAIPVLLPPVYIQSIPYADGGMSNNLPVEPFLQAKEKLIGIHVNPLTDFDRSAGMIHATDRAMHLMMRSNVMRSMKSCDLFIEPPALKNYHLFESKKTKELIACGYLHVKNELDVSTLKLQYEN